MAKKNNNPDQQENKSGKDSFGTKLATFIIIIIIVLVWLAILAMLVKFDVGGLGTFFRPYIEEVPGLNLILPELSDEEIIYRERYPYKNIKEAHARIKELEELVDKYSEENDDYARRFRELQSENENYKHFEEEYETYRRLRDKFDREIVYNDKAPSAEDYIAWYEAMYPENAAAIYEELKEQQSVDQSVQELANAVAKMKAKDAAKMFEEFTSDIDLICKVFSCLKTSQISDILTEMVKDNPTFAARVSNRWNDINEGK